MDSEQSSPSTRPPKKLSFVATIVHILNTGGLTAFWRGLGPALVLVANPVLQYTVFEQLKNALVARRKRARGAKNAGALLFDLDFFVLGALSKLGELLC
jgi:solute carrier family 25 (peroxisomal adenine nucleotide transporter), member 17